MEVATYVTQALHHICVIMLLRLLPFATSVVVSARTVPRDRAAIVGLYGLVIAGAYATGQLWRLPWVALVWVYYLVASVGVHRLSGFMVEGLLTRGAAFVVLVGIYLLLPGLLFSGLAISAFLVVGWGLTMSSYSYCAETSRPGTATPSLADCLFFLLVNPTLHYGQRGTNVRESPVGSRYGGLGRAMVGVGVVLLGAGVLRPLSNFIGAGPGAALLPAGVGLASYGFVRLLLEYAAHSGLASIQIGFTRFLGWRVPERYNYPLAATSPMDFWRRWNIYVRVWLEAYVFLPLARRCARANLSRKVYPAAAAVATLIASGLLHDAYVFAGRQVLVTTFLELFLVAGALLIVWRYMGRLGTAIAVSLGARARAQIEIVANLTGRAVVLLSLVGAAVTWG